jgi:hypothetical protein
VPYLYKYEADRVLSLYQDCPDPNDLHFLFDKELSSRDAVIRLASLVLQQEQRGVIGLFGGFIMDYMFDLQYPGKTGQPGQPLPIKDLDVAMVNSKACAAFVTWLQGLFRGAESEARSPRRSRERVGSLHVKPHPYPRRLEVCAHMKWRLLRTRVLQWRVTAGLF